MNIIVLGSGAWGTALSLTLLHNGHRTTLWSHDPAKAARMDRERVNPRLPGIDLPEALTITGDPAALGSAELCVFAPPSHALRSVARLAAPHLPPEVPLVSASKGIESGTSLRMTEILQQVCGSTHPVAALSGPSHAEEAARRMPTGVVAASRSRTAAELVQACFMNAFFRVYTNPDIVGVELCGALKNVVALGCGIADGLGYGDNARAMLITRAMNEAAALCIQAGGSGLTCAGLAGTGDLIVTCSSRHSRNRRAGILIGEGTPIRETLQQVGAVVEGYYAAASVRELALRLGVDMPICSCIYNILYADMRADGAMRQLMVRDRREEFSFPDWI